VRKNLTDRLGLTLLLSLFIFLMFLLTAMIVGLMSFMFYKAGASGVLSSRGGLYTVLSALLASVIVGTVLTTILGGKSLHKLQRMIDAINRLADGDFSARLDIRRPPELRELSDSFNRMAKELGNTEMLRSDFVNDFSHEFKTPIVSIKGFAEMLKYGDLTQEERDEYLDIVISESSRLASLATNVLNLSKVEDQEILTEKKTFDLGEQVRRSVLVLEPKWEKKHITVSADIQEVTYRGGEELLGQVWLNLMDNAVKFAPEGGEVEIYLRETENGAEFKIKNSGPGIEPEKQARIFDKFYQTDQSHATPGNGLGLAIARRIVQLHGGSITCKSAAGEGTEFTVALPKG